MAIAAFRVRQRRKDYQELVTRVRSEIEQSLSSLRTAEEQVAFYRREAIPIAEANEAGGRSVFMAGAQSILVLLEAQRSLIARRRGYVATRGDYAAAYVELERVVGGRLPFSTSSRPALLREKIDD
jgi:outer membrane protein TolC